MRVSAGIVLYRRVGGGLEVLLAHPGGPLFARRDEGHWTIPKGEPGPDEALTETARREFAEETGHDPGDGPMVALGSIVQKGGKVVHAWATEGELDPELARSDTFQMAWPPGSGRLQAFPEIDRVAWFGPSEARRRIKPAQIPLLDRLEETLAADRGPRAAAANAAMGPEVERLTHLLDELGGLLAAHRRADWARWVASDAASLRAGHGHGLTHFLSAFGGMGSLNDVVLEPRSEDERFESLKEEAWTLATALLRSDEGGA